MDTVAKGDRFEDAVFASIQELLKNEQLGLSPSQARLFKKKGYHSKDRDSDIIVDISVELWLPKANTYSLLWVCECKDYSHPVPVDDMEEFKAKLDQIAGKNVKGVFASRNALQRGALNYARSNGIGIIRILPDDQVRWVLYMMKVPEGDLSAHLTRLRAQEIAETRAGLVNQTHVSENRSFYAAEGDALFSDLLSFLLHSINE